jgi:hypothetical protein
MIYPFNNATQTRWDKGELKVQLLLPENSRPMGYCDGTEADLAELKSMADAENSTLTVDKKVLKTGREIWTVRGAG